VQNTLDVNQILADTSVTIATADLKSSSPYKQLSGRITFELVTGSVNMNTRICGFLPGSAHAIAILPSGDLTNITGSATTITTATADQRGVIDTTIQGLPVNLVSITGKSILVFDGTDTSDATTYALAGVLGVAGTNPGVVDIVCPVEWASCLLRPTAGNNATGTVFFKHYINDNSSVVITGTISGFVPNTLHAWHVHEYGNIGTSDGTGAGTHYDPLQTGTHALPFNTPRHIGDMGNLVADANGNVAINAVFNESLVYGLNAQNSIIGRALIVHQRTDDGSQPVGNAGTRYAQCVIGISNTASSDIKNVAYGSPSTAIGNYFGTCELANVSPSYSISGRIILSESTNGMRIQAAICGLPPQTTHGIHVHEFGDLTGGTIASLIGSHYNPFSTAHSFPDITNNRHLGDLGNVTAGEGKLLVDKTVNLISMVGSNSLLGRSIVIKEFADDGSQPDGNAGQPVAVCVLGYVNTMTVDNVVCATTAPPTTTTAAPTPAPTTQPPYTPTPTPTPESSPSVFNGWQIVLIIIAVLIAVAAVLGLVGFVVFYYVKTRANRNAYRPTTVELDLEEPTSPYSPIHHEL
jgi:Cu-Zn family superoxide dismutase